MKIDINETAARHSRNYEAFWGRPCDLVYHPDAGATPHIDVFRFPPLARRRFFRGLFASAPKEYVYITGGMADTLMTTPPDQAGLPGRVELTAFAREPVFLPSGEDAAALCLSALAYSPFRQGGFFTPGHTVDMREVMLPGSAMSAFFLGVTPSVDMRRLCAASGRAVLMLHITPISEKERALAMQSGPDALMNVLEKAGVPPIFDLNRPSCL
jgi:hypothetical protein